MVFYIAAVVVSFLGGIPAGTVSWLWAVAGPVEVT